MSKTKSDKRIGHAALFENSLFKTKVQRNAFVVISITLSILLGASEVRYINLSNEIKDKIKYQKTILLPAIHEEIIVEGGEQVSREFSRAFIGKVINLLENWNQYSIEDHFDQLFKFYYTHRMEETTKANLDVTQLIETVKEKKIVSEIDINWEKSKIKHCPELRHKGRICAVVVGDRKMWINRNEPYQEREVAYFVLAKIVRPDRKRNPLALRATRVTPFDGDKDNFSKALRHLSLAENGEIPKRSNQ